MSWEKRWITLAPVATVLGLAFKMYDPDHLLGDKEDIGITCALVPTEHEGVCIGRRHFPGGAAFMNGPTWGKEISTKAAQGLIVFLILVTLFLSLYFQWQMAVAALVALVHDVLITIGIYALSGFEVTPATVIGVLTILGFSLYDTVVVFDKVRENTAGIASTSRMTYSESANLALNQTLVRSINTSIVALLLMGFGIVTQLAPALLCVLIGRPRANHLGAMAGIVVGVGFVAATVVTGATTRTLLPMAPAWVHDLNIGLVGLALNTAVLLIVSRLTWRAAPIPRALPHRSACR